MMTSEAEAVVIGVLWRQARRSAEDQRVSIDLAVSEKAGAARSAAT